MAFWRTALNISIHISLWSSAAAAQLPPGFVYLREIDPTIRQDIRYATPHNFVGRPIVGYLASECILTQQAALALKKVQDSLKRSQQTLIVWDCYRPSRAVEDFLQWSKKPAEIQMKAEFFPRINKNELFSLGYIARKSGHSRGSAVDLGIMPLGSALPSFASEQKLISCLKAKDERFNDGALDFGTGYDCLDVNSGDGGEALGESALKNRKNLRDLMISSGFRPYAKEWWHFELKGEPFPNTQFDFVVQ